MNHAFSIEASSRAMFRQRLRRLTLASLPSGIVRVDALIIITTSTKACLAERKLQIPDSVGFLLKRYAPLLISKVPQGYVL